MKSIRELIEGDKVNSIKRGRECTIYKKYNTHIKVYWTDTPPPTGKIYDVNISDIERVFGVSPK